mgnify:FL=1
MLVGKKCHLTAVNSQSLEQMREWRNDPELRQYFREYREISDFMQNSWYERVSKDQNQVNFEIRDPAKDVLIGHCGLYYIDWRSRHAEFGIYVGHNSYRSSGYGSDALRTLIRYGFNDLNLNKIWCEVYSNNKALDIYRHVGFKDEGILRDKYFNNGRYWDSYMLSMLKKDFNTLPS